MEFWEGEEGVLNKVGVLLVTRTVFVCLEFSDGVLV